MLRLSNESFIFPELLCDISESEIILFSMAIKQSKWPTGENLRIIWNVFKEEINNIHQCGYVHGDILKKNIIFDGKNLRLIDHEISLFVKNQLRATFPWISVEDLKMQNLTKKTDEVCLLATELRLFDFTAYAEYRKKQCDIIKSCMNK